MRRRTQLILIWLAAALVLGGALAAAQLGKDPLDDPDLAYQRPGFLGADGEPFPAPAVNGDVPSAGSRAVVFFTRPERSENLAGALAERQSLRERALLILVVAGATAPASVADVPVVADPARQLAAAYRMPVPSDRGPPVGYAIVDRDGRVRYRTLDPDTAEHLDEVETMVRATP